MQKAKWLEDGNETLKTYTTEYEATLEGALELLEDEGMWLAQSPEKARRLEKAIDLIRANLQREAA